MENLEDLWKVSRLQRERKAKEEREKAARLAGLRRELLLAYGAPAPQPAAEEVAAAVREIEQQDIAAGAAGAGGRGGPGGEAGSGGGNSVGAAGACAPGAAQAGAGAGPLSQPSLPQQSVGTEEMGIERGSAGTPAAGGGRPGRAAYVQGVAGGGVRGGWAMQLARLRALAAGLDDPEAE